MTSASHDGFLLIDKPSGRSSHDVVAIVRRARGKVRTGHTGTLDPFATGLLLVALGRATRLIRFVPAEPKVYEATIVFGSATDTDDSTGNVVEHGPVPDESSIRQAITHLTGTLQQVPPGFSAKHVAGRRAYSLARRGVEVSLPPVEVTVDGWQVHEVVDGVLHATITCSAGTYIRALARDLGRRCGTVAHLGTLRRTRIGPFDVRDAVAPDAAGDAPVLAPEAALLGMHRMVVSPDEARHVSHGRAIEAQQPAQATNPGNQQLATRGLSALLDESGNLIAVAEREGDWLRPKVVMRDA